MDNDTVNSCAFTDLPTRSRRLDDGCGTAWEVHHGKSGGEWKASFRFAHRVVWAAFPQGTLQVAAGVESERTIGECPAAIHALDHERGAITIILRENRFETARSIVRTCQAGGGIEVDLFLTPRSDGTSGDFTEFRIFFNRFPFPANAARNWRISDPLDLRVLLTGIYAGAAACLGGAEIEGSAYPTMRLPLRPYGELHTFFDIDAYFTVATLCLSGDPILEAEARRIIQRAARHQKPDGQIPHHFDRDEPVWVAISGAAQPGPNLFWLIALHDYYCQTGDAGFLQKHHPALLRAVAWLEKCHDPQHKLIHADGPLWIDVFRKSGFTFDANVMAIHVLSRVAPLCGLCGDPSAQARITNLVENLREGIEALWEKDHFITSIGRDGSRCDMVDSDNYAAVAFGLIRDRQRAGQLVRFMDAVPHMHPGGKATWVSGRYYDEAKCYHGNVGDSACAMARLFWIDMKARHHLGDRESFLCYFQRVRQDLLDRTWMCERYDMNGDMIRADGYAEYPEILALLVREAWHGIDLGADNVTVNPLKPGEWTYANPRMEIVYGPSELSLRVPGHGVRTFRIAGLARLKSYRLDGGACVRSDAHGVLEFQGEAGIIHHALAIE